MSRPNTRNKNKRPRADESESSTAAVFKKIHTTGDITKSDIRQLYMVWKPICHGCHGNSKDSPNCFCGLIPAANGVRKTGLWQKTQDIVRSFGPDPSEDLRDSAERPAGLTNLGATCYANSILQCLYMNKSFRSGIFSLEPDILRKHPVLDQLARLFAQLHSSKMTFIDSAPFIKTLELDNGVQQDGHEFLTLFLSLLEQSLNHSKVSGRTIVQHLFRGSVSHMTRCLSCGKDSAASSKMEDFYELELNIKGLNNLEESLNEYFSEEALDGDNQYFCESCQKRVDATRCIKLRSLPPVVNFHLKRYVFLPKTTTKKKISSAFNFPGRLDLGKWLSSPLSGVTYDLAAILIHKGTAANSGHYVAHIKDESNGQWWEFDDETVSELGSHPFGEKIVKSSNKDDQKSQGISADWLRQWADSIDPPSSIDNGPIQCEHGKVPASKVTSMKRLSAVAWQKLFSKYGGGPALGSDDSCMECLMVGAKNVVSADVYRDRKASFKSLAEAALAGSCSDDTSYFISRTWLSQWLRKKNADMPSDGDNGPTSALRCCHGDLLPEHALGAKRIVNHVKSATKNCLTLHLLRVILEQ
ncbi:hypothetical protein QOZ80_4AG0310280 [Eleusine coracana subsp. coracana]|nr:hypothetical protein QOZ80_4AG0310280 [Eleusine coracana subsp. coracana]